MGSVSVLLKGFKKIAGFAGDAMMVESVTHIVQNIFGFATTRHDCVHGVVQHLTKK